MRQADRPLVVRHAGACCGMVESALCVCVRSSVGMMNANFLFDPELLHFTQVRNKLCVQRCVYVI